MTAEADVVQARRLMVRGNNRGIDFVDGGGSPFGHFGNKGFVDYAVEEELVGMDVVVVVFFPAGFENGREVLGRLGLSRI